MNGARLIGAAAAVPLLLAAGLAGSQSLPVPSSVTANRMLPADNAERARGIQIAIGGGPGEYIVACAQCHGLDGSGDPSGAFPRLAGQSAWYLYKTLADYRSGQRPNGVMSPIAQALDEGDMGAVATHYSALDGSSPARPHIASRDLLQLGGAISAVGVARDGIPACSSCHGQGGEGGAPTAPVLAGQPAAYLEGQLQAWKQGRRAGDPLGVMAATARTMSNGQIRAVSAYFAAAPAPAQAKAMSGTLPFASEIAPEPVPSGPTPPYLSPTPSAPARQ